MPLIGESAVPWLAASLVIGVLALVLALRGTELEVTEQLVMAVGLAGTMTAAALVVARSRRELEAAVREERLRPAADELATPLGTERLSYGQGMEAWTGAVQELVEHAVSVLAADAPERRLLAAAAEETRDLHELLLVDAEGQLPINDQAKLHALGSLWETNQSRIEEMAGAADPAWYRRWRARSVTERQLRHGIDQTHRVDLPYRT
jgi:hypothetical protein